MLRNTPFKKQSQALGLIRHRLPPTGTNLLTDMNATRGPVVFQRQTPPRHGRPQLHEEQTLNRSPSSPGTSARPAGLKSVLNCFSTL